MSFTVRSHLNDGIGATTIVRKGNVGVVKKLMSQIAAFEQDIAAHSRPVAFVHNAKALRKQSSHDVKGQRDTFSPDAPQRASSTC